MLSGVINLLTFPKLMMILPGLNGPLFSLMANRKFYKQVVEKRKKEESELLMENKISNKIDLLSSMLTASESNSKFTFPELISNINMVFFHLI
jgi:hypothetical protein